MNNDIGRIIFELKQYIQSLTFSNVSSPYFIYKTYGLDSDLHDSYEFYNRLNISCCRKKTKTGRLSPTHKIYYLSSLSMPFYNNWVITQKTFSVSASKSYDSNLYINLKNKTLQASLFLRFGVNIDFKEGSVKNIRLYDSSPNSFNNSVMFSKNPLSDFVIKNADVFILDEDNMKYGNEELLWHIRTQSIQEPVHFEGGAC